MGSFGPEYSSKKANTPVIPRMLRNHTSHISLARRDCPITLDGFNLAVKIANISDFIQEIVGKTEQ
jgi:hypothetical protein